MKFKAVIFDLDGTLVNSIQDIADAMNTVLQNYNYPTHSYEKHQSFIGSGIRSLVQKSLPESNNNENQVDICSNAMIEVYRENCTNKTKPYDGIVELLDYLILYYMIFAIFYADQFSYQPCVFLYLAL